MHVLGTFTGAKTREMAATCVKSVQVHPDPRAAMFRERVPANLYLPQPASPPWQTF